MSTAFPASRGHPGPALSADPANVEFWAGIARQAAGVAAERAWSEGYAAAMADVKRIEHGMVAGLQLEARRWHVCCGPCRRNGHRDGCSSCQGRSRATFSKPHPDDYQGASR